jgi:hypothetical protein
MKQQRFVIMTKTLGKKAGATQFLPKPLGLSARKLITHLTRQLQHKSEQHYTWKGITNQRRSVHVNRVSPANILKNRKKKSSHFHGSIVFHNIG